MLALVLVVAIGALAIGFLAIAEVYARSRAASLSQERAVFAAESGLSYYVARLSLDPEYLADYPAPHAASQIGSCTFELERASRGETDEQWIVVCAGRDEDITYRVQAVLGRDAVRIPEGILVAGTGDQSNVAFDIQGNSSVRRYDPLEGESNINIAGDAVIKVNGSLHVVSSTVDADVTVSGVVSGDGGSINGTLTENGPEAPVESVDAMVNDLDEAYRLENDNQVLASNWSDRFTVEPDGSGSFIASGGRYVLPSGTYRFQALSLREEATLVFDTSSGPATIVCVGELHVNGSSVLIDPGTTENGLLTVLGPACSVEIDAYSVFGRLETGLDTPAYSRIIGPRASEGSPRLWIDGDSALYGHLHAAGHALTLRGSSSWYGSGIVRSGLLDSAVFFFTPPERSSASVVSPGDYRILAQWEREPNPAADLADLRDRLQTLKDGLPALIAALLQPVLDLMDSALSELAKTPPDTVAALVSLGSAQASLQVLIDGGIIDPVEGQGFMNELSLIIDDLQ